MRMCCSAGDRNTKTALVNGSQTLGLDAQHSLEQPSAHVFFVIQTVVITQQARLPFCWCCHRCVA